MNIISWNVNGVRAVVKKDFFESIEKINPDILCLQETKAQDDETKKALLSMEGYHGTYNSAEKKGYSGTAILSKREPIAVFLDMGIAEHDAEGRIQCAEYEDFYLVNVYVPNSGQKLDRLDYRKKWDADFLAYLKNLEKKKPVIACGDFNVAHKAMDLKNDKSNYNKTAGYTQIEIDGMDNFINAGFVDAFRQLHPDEIAYTYWSYRFKARERNTGWRIDYFLVSASLVDKIKSVSIYSEVLGSDHCPIGLEIDL
ncbi:exodeoxyribonuclease III [Maribacter polysiphoniae]|uniref:Exodeoxyribonuclease III n=1 Tax=Maribacter polysiphoniae TaxID=429344 RepID=A0A316E076_9FLAO|nr:exodeoxyribonuclease III [Maribacter polysiphoniae]MBD1259770.1 exodeoxyribonuclease III [Maribacter polysiphoniae]PWK23088.1 exodeoxyribonuclease-3 [Maribacter polysiphoniae]